MTHRSLQGRHRADGPASTPLGNLSDLSDKVSSALISPAAARGGLALAVSSGLVAGGALPAGATPRASAFVGAGVSAMVELRATTAAERHAAHRAAAARSAAHRAHLAHLAHKTHSAHLAHHRAGAKRQAAAKRAADAKRAAAKRAADARNRAAASRSATRSSSSRGAAVIAIASRYFGVPYRYGGTTPRGFDCSGFSQYVYAQVGVRLPRTAQQQYNATTRIARSQARPGDLVFFFTGGGVTHLGIYSGGNMMIAAPHTGTVVRKQPIYSANVGFGRA